MFNHGDADVTIDYSTLNSTYSTADVLTSQWTIPFLSPLSPLPSPFSSLIFPRSRLSLSPPQLAICPPIMVHSAPPQPPPPMMVQSPPTIVSSSPLAPAQRDLSLSIYICTHTESLTCPTAPVYVYISCKYE